MKCQDADRYLQAFVDGEFSETEQTEIEQHFKFCPVCQKKVAFESWFKKNTTKSFTDTKAPRRLEAEIGYMLSKERGRQTPMWVKLSPAMALLLAFFAIYFMPHIEVSTPIVEATIDRHLKSLPFDVQSPDTIEVRNFLQEKIKYPVHIPRFTHHPMQLMGGRVTTVQDHNAAYLVFSNNGHRYSVVAKPANPDESDIPEGIQRTVSGRKFTLVKKNGFNVVLWNANQMLYTLASDQDEDTMINLAASVEYDKH